MFAFLGFRIIFANTSDILNKTRFYYIWPKQVTIDEKNY
jgi:hypothetical protein